LVNITVSYIRTVHRVYTQNSIIIIIIKIYIISMGRHRSQLYTLHYFSYHTEQRTEGSPVVTTVVKCTTVDGCLTKWETTGDRSISTSKLATHLATVHPRQYLQYLQQIGQSDVPSSSSSQESTQVSPSSSALGKRSISNVSTMSSSKYLSQSSPSHTDLKANAVQAMVKFFTVCNIPFRVVDQPVFRSFMQCLLEFQTGEIVMNRHRLQEHTLIEYDSLRRALLNKLSQPLHFTTLALDSYTNVNRDKVTNIMLISNGIAYYYTSLFNLTEANTTHWVTSRLVPVVDELIRAGVRLVGMVTDNGKVESIVRETIQHKYHLVSVPCAAHTVQLIVRRILAQAPIINLFKRVDEILDSISSDKYIRLELKKHTHLKVRRYNVTRWNTQLYTLQRMVEMSDAFKSVSEYLGEGHKINISDDEWMLVKDVIAILKPFQLVTDKVQGNKATLLDVYKSFNTLAQYVSSDKGFSTTALNDIDWQSESEQSIASIIKYRYLNFTNVAALKTIHFLCDVQMQDRNTFQDVSAIELRNEIFAIMKRLLHTTSSVSSNEDSEEMAVMVAKITAQIASYKFKSGKFALTVPELLNWTGSRENVKKYWSDRLDYTETYETALAAHGLMNVNPSEASVERSFSIQKLIHSNLRNRLSSESVIACMFIKINAPLLDGDNNTIWDKEMYDTVYEDDNEMVEVPMNCSDFSKSN
jgi:hypothetical protein